MKKILLAITFVIAASSVNVFSQVVYIPQLDPVRMQIQNELVRQMVLAEALKGKGAKSGAAATKAAPAAVDYTVFKPRAENYLPQLLAQSVKGNANEQREAERFFNSQIELYEQTAAYYRYPASDVAYALEYFISNNYEIYYDLVPFPRDKDPYLKRAKNLFDEMALVSQKKSDKVSSIQDRAMYFQIKDMLSAKPEFRKLTNEQKQMMTETLAIKLGIIFGKYTNAVNDNDEQAIEQAHKEARENLESLLGVPLERIKILDDGLRFQ